MKSPRSPVLSSSRTCRCTASSTGVRTASPPARLRGLDKCYTRTPLPPDRVRGCFPRPMPHHMLRPERRTPPRGSCPLRTLRVPHPLRPPPGNEDAYLPPPTSCGVRRAVRYRDAGRSMSPTATSHLQLSKKPKAKNAANQKSEQIPKPKISTENRLLTVYDSRGMPRLSPQRRWLMRVAMPFVTAKPLPEVPRSRSSIKSSR